jgi:aminoglycoside 6'-N-acetyltransferase I
MNYEVRRARPADRPEILALQSHGFGSQPAGRAAAVAGELEFPDPWLWVATAAGQARPVAVARLRLIEMASGPPAGHYLSGVIVDPAHRGHGIGGLLVRERTDFAWSAGAAALYYFANSRNATTIALHAKLGFREIQRPFEFPRVEFEDGVGVLFRLDRPDA